MLIKKKKEMDLIKIGLSIDIDRKKTMTTWRGYTS
jgi:hypothetical protein